MLIFETAIAQLKEGKDELEQAKITLFIHSNKDFLERTFEDSSIKGMPVKLGDDIKNFDIYALNVVNRLRDIKNQVLNNL